MFNQEANPSATVPMQVYLPAYREADRKQTGFVEAQAGAEILKRSGLPVATLQKVYKNYFLLLTQFSLPYYLLDMASSWYRETRNPYPWPVLPCTETSSTCTAGWRPLLLASTQSEPPYCPNFTNPINVCGVHECCWPRVDFKCWSSSVWTSVFVFGACKWVYNGGSCKGGESKENSLIPWMKSLFLSWVTRGDLLLLIFYICTIIEWCSK